MYNIAITSTRDRIDELKKIKQITKKRGGVAGWVVSCGPDLYICTVMGYRYRKLYTKKR